MTDTGLARWIKEQRRHNDEWESRTVAGSEDRPWVVDGVRRLCLVRTNEGRWGVLEHGGWTESPLTAGGEPKTIGRFSSGYLPPDWHPTEDLARAAYAMTLADDAGEMA